MGKANRKTDEGRYKDNRGTGEFESYIPWHFVVEVGSYGASYRPLGIKVRRVHVFLSTIEYRYFLIAEWNESVIDLREQYPIDIGATKIIANQLGVKHPKEKFKNKVMTSDFVLTIKSNEGLTTIARAIKAESELSNPRTIEKLSIEREYWRRQGFDWKLITDADISKILAKNIEIVRASYLDSLEHGLDARIVNFVLSRWENYHYDEVVNFIELGKEVDAFFKLEQGTTLRTVKAMIYGKQILVDVYNRKLNFKKIRKVESYD